MKMSNPAKLNQKNQKNNPNNLPPKNQYREGSHNNSKGIKSHTRSLSSLLSRKSRELKNIWSDNKNNPKKIKKTLNLRKNCSLRLILSRLV
jgi:hypothetical protein